MKLIEQESRKKLHNKIIAERWLYVAEWCKKRGLSPMIIENYNKAVMMWSIENSPKYNKLIKYDS